MDTLRVDYNRVDNRGFFPSLIRGSWGWHLEAGELVLAEDAEGTRCKAYVEEIRRFPREGKAVAYLSLIPGKVEPNYRDDWIGYDFERQIAAG